MFFNSHFKIVLSVPTKPSLHLTADRTGLFSFLLQRKQKINLFQKSFHPGTIFDIWTRWNRCMMLFVHWFDVCGIWWGDVISQHKKLKLSHNKGIPKMMFAYWCQLQKNTCRGSSIQNINSLPLAACSHECNILENIWEDIFPSYRKCIKSTENANYVLL